MRRAGSNMKSTSFTLRLIILSCAVALSVRPGSACSCIQDRRLVEEAYPHYDAVFVGQVVRMWLPGVEASSKGEVEDDPHLVEIRVLKSWKGAKGDKIVVRSTQDGMCGYPFVLGRKYLVWASAATDGGPLWVYLCSRTTPLGTGPTDVDMEALDEIVQGEAKPRGK